jgi:predicted dehydrogenase
VTRLNIGVVGAGYIAQAFHIPNYVNHPGVNMAGVADVDRAKLDEVGKKYGVKKLFTDYRELLN